MRAALALPLLILAACSSESAVRTVTVKVPVVAACTPATLPPPPTYPDTDDILLAAADAAERYRLLILGREERDARLGVVEPVVEACR